ncbi:MAG: hypothetical protein AAGM22_25810 [Acidobacteriota bacterium]
MPKLATARGLLKSKSFWSAVLAFLGLLAAYLAIISNHLLAPEPEPLFALPNPNLRPGVPLVIAAENKQAEKTENLTVRILDIEYAGAARLIPGTDPLTWQLDVSRFRLEPEKKYQLELRFQGRHYGQRLLHFFVTERLDVSASVTPNSVRVDAVTLGDENYVDVELVFLGAEFEQRITPDFSAQSVLNPNHPDEVLIQYSYKFDVQLPTFSAEDERYDAPFLKIIARNQSGQTFSAQHPYAAVANSKGGLFLANAEEFRELLVNVTDAEFGSGKSFDIQLDPRKATNISRLDDGSPAIRLRVRLLDSGDRELAWESRMRPGIDRLSHVYRGEEKIASTFGSEHIDTNRVELDKVQYQVRQPINGEVFVSRAESVRGQPPAPTPLPETPILTGPTPPATSASSTSDSNTQSESSPGLNHHRLDGSQLPGRNKKIASDLFFSQVFWVDDTESFRLEFEECYQMIPGRLFGVLVFQGESLVWSDFVEGNTALSGGGCDDFAVLREMPLTNAPVQFSIVAGILGSADDPTSFRFEGPQDGFPPPRRVALIVLRNHARLQISVRANDHDIPPKALSQLVRRSVRHNSN